VLTQLDQNVAVLIYNPVMFYRSFLAQIMLASLTILAATVNVQASPSKEIYSVDIGFNQKVSVAQTINLIGDSLDQQYKELRLSIELQTPDIKIPLIVDSTDSTLDSIQKAYFSSFNNQVSRLEESKNNFEQNKLGDMAINDTMSTSQFPRHFVLF
jgi:hypothetical protein